MADVVLYMMVGVPGSGKSYLAQSLNCPVVSSDAIRGELFGDENDQTHNQEVFNEVHNRIRRHLLAGTSCVYDATNLSRSRRKKFLKDLPAGVKKIAVVAATELDIILAQNASRERHVPEDVIMRMYKQMTLPRLDEGWDGIRMVAHPKNSKTLGEYLYDSYGIDHDNPHHSANIFDHMIEAGAYASKHGAEKGLSKDQIHLARTAALFHDIGKPVVKSRYKMNGQLDDKSHYYNHAEIGAYMMACCSGGEFATDKQHALLANMIVLTQWHMEAFADPDHYIENFEKYYGEDMRKVYELVHEADLNAH